MKHLILGSSGLIGTYLTEYLTSLGEEVIPFDIKRDEFNEDLRYVDVRTLPKESFQKKMEECDFVYFLAFDVGGSEYIKTHQYSYDFISNNIKIMDNVFTLLELTKKPFIFASSQMSNMSHTTYGVLKLLGEYYTKSLNGVIIKFWNVYGIEHDPAKSHVITDFMESAKYSKVIHMRTDGLESRQFLFGPDAARCLHELAKHYDEIDREKPLHCTSFRWYTIKQIAEYVSAIYGACPIIEGTAKDTLQGGFKNEPDEYIQKFWSPQIPLLNGLQIMMPLI